VPFLPRDFVVPTLVERPRFRVRHITVHDVVKDYDAVMTNRQQLWAMFGEAWGWPAADLSLEQDLIDLAWHQKEGDLRRAFNFAVLTPDESRLLGCVYIDPPEKQGADADVTFWLRGDADHDGLAGELEAFVRSWIADAWPFGTVRYPGRDLSWAAWNALPDE
jgi:hypothetical protein